MASTSNGSFGSGIKNTGWKLSDSLLFLRGFVFCSQTTTTQNNNNNNNNNNTSGAAGRSRRSSGGQNECLFSKWLNSQWRLWRKFIFFVHSPKLKYDTTSTELPLFKPPSICFCLLDFVFWGETRRLSGVFKQKFFTQSRPARQSSSMLDEGHRIQHSLDIPPEGPGVKLQKLTRQIFCSWVRFKIPNYVPDSNGWEWIHLKTKQLQICDSKFKFILGKSNSARSNPKIQLRKKSIHFSQKVLVISKRIALKKKKRRRPLETH